MLSIHESVFVAPQVQLYGEIAVGRESSLWPSAVIRAEAQAVRIGRYTNIQDLVMVHIGYDHAIEIGDFCSITHHATVHGCRIEDHCLVGINAVIMDGAVIGEGSIVAGGAMVTEGAVFPPESIIAGLPAKRVNQRDNRHENRLNAWRYHRNSQATAGGSTGAGRARNTRLGSPPSVQRSKAIATSSYSWATRRVRRAPGPGTAD